MRKINNFISALTVFFLVSCDRTDFNTKDGAALPGTETAIVGLYIDKNGYPQASVDKVKVFPGQKIIFAGPEKFDIVFKDEKSPTGRLETTSENGIVIIEIPQNIFEREQRETKSADEKKELVYNYGIRANGKFTDPQIVVDRR